MINEKGMQAAAAATFIPGLCRPLYGSYSFARIPATISDLLTGEKSSRGLPSDVTGGAEGPFDAVIVLLIDGFGWRFFEKYAERFPFLKRFLGGEGTATKILSQFPSTTAPHVTCMNTGLSVGESGVYEWFYYEPKVDAVIAPLLFSYAGDKELGTLEKTGIRAEDLLPKETFYQQLKRKGIETYLFQQESIVDSHYSRAMCKGANVCSFEDLDDALDDLIGKVQKAPTPSYFYLYFGDIDSAGHRHGIDSKEFEETVEFCFAQLEQKFWEPLQKISKKMATIVIADHGMLALNPKESFYLNEEIPECVEWFQQNRKGKPIVPAGSCRDFFAHIRPECLDEAESVLKERLNGFAAIFRTEELIAKGFFGEKPVSAAFRERVGNLVILPYEGNAVWWHEKGRFAQHFYGSHGGLTRSEMETIFLFINSPFK